MITVKTIVPRNLLQINSTLQAILISFSLGNVWFLCSVYFLPNDQISTSQIDQLVDQLSKPAVIVRDMNAHNPLWYDHRLDTEGAEI